MDRRVEAVIGIIKLAELLVAGCRREKGRHFEAIDRLIGSSSWRSFSLIFHLCLLSQLPLEPLERVL